MTNTFVIPLQGFPQVFDIALAGTTYTMSVYWNDADEGGWTFDMSNADTGDILFVGAPFITGANLLSGLDYLGINGEMYVYTDGNPTAVPTFDNLGTDCNLYFVTTAASNG